MSTTKKPTRAEIQKTQQQLLLKSLAKKVEQNQGNLDPEEEEEKHEFDSDDDNEYRYKLKPNINHILREQAQKDEEEYDTVIDGNSN